MSRAKYRKWLGVIVLAVVTCSHAWCMERYHPLTLPRVEDLLAFANSPRTDFGPQAASASRERIFEFIAHGRNNTDPATWPAVLRVEQVIDVHAVPQGVFTDKAGTVYFWRLSNERTLFLETEDGATALIQLN